MSSLVVAILVGLAVTQVSIILTTVYLHRAVAHRSIRLSPGVAWVCRLLIWMSTGIRPRQWAAVHRKHHAYTDVEGDPHSPVLLGYWKVQIANANLYRRIARDPDQVARYTRDLQPDVWDRVLFDHGILGLALGVGLLVLALGWEMALVASAVHVAVYLALNAAINAVGHSFGSQPYENTARNNQWLAWITAGEGLHNNHHAAPTSARLALSSAEVDPGWWVIRVLERFKWATVRHADVKLRGPRLKEGSAA